VAIQLVNGYPCRNCSDVELARKGIDPAKPKVPVSGNEVFVSKEEADRNRVGHALPLEAGKVGSRLNLLA
jgi:hypothetical protein